MYGENRDVFLFVRRVVGGRGLILLERHSRVSLGVGMVEGPLTVESRLTL